jgi:DedD protein
MESRAKQRLTGAIILVALFVLLVPELLTGPRDAHPDAQAQGDEGMRRYTIDLDAQRTATTPPAPAAEPAMALPPVVTPMAAEPARAMPGESAAAAPVTTPAASATPPSVAHAEPARVEPPHQNAPNRNESGSFAVQLGTFGKRENADRLARDMTAKGFAASVVPTTTNGHDLFRVRVGPARDRAAAEALAAELKRVGQLGSIVPIS